MAKTSKKQPFKNALLKLKTRRVLLDALYKENQRLNASLRHKQEEAQSLLKSAAADKETAMRFRDSMRAELKAENRYHPDLFYTQMINVPVEEAMRYRISSPYLHWDDEINQGLVRIVCRDNTGKTETGAYALSANYLRTLKHRGYINEELINDLAKNIATDLIKLVTTKIKEP